jgi:hypothetical protein
MAANNGRYIGCVFYVLPSTFQSLNIFESGTEQVIQTIIASVPLAVTSQENHIFDPKTN